MFLQNKKGVGLSVELNIYIHWIRIKFMKDEVQNSLFQDVLCGEWFDTQFDYKKISLSMKL